MFLSALERSLYLFKSNMVSLVVMTDLRENLGWLVGSIATAVAMAVGWFISSGVVVNLLFLLIGAGITYFVQTRTQRKAWKREYSIKIAETVYGSLYRQVKSVVWSLEQKRLDPINFEEWGQLQQDHRYFMVDEKFRNKLDGFLEKVRKYSLDVHRLENEVLPRIIHEESKEIFKTDTEGVRIHVEIRYEEKARVISGTYDIIECLISQTNPRDSVLKRHPEAEILEFAMKFGQVPASSTAIGKFDDFWESCLRRMKADSNYQSLLQETNRLLEEAKSVKKEIVKRIEEPWKI